MWILKGTRPIVARQAKIVEGFVFAVARGRQKHCVTIRTVNQRIAHTVLCREKGTI